MKRLPRLRNRADGTAAPAERRRLPPTLCLVWQFSGTALPCADAGRHLPAHHSRWPPGLRCALALCGGLSRWSGVVQHQNGRSTHIESPRRNPLHGAWFLDLDVFHQGVPFELEDEAGWMHIDRAGEPIYARRFANVEPFYNGQARVERFDGGLRVIDESRCARRAPSCIATRICGRYVAVWLASGGLTIRSCRRAGCVRSLTWNASEEVARALRAS